MKIKEFDIIIEYNKDYYCKLDFKKFEDMLKKEDINIEHRKTDIGYKLLILNKNDNKQIGNIKVLDNNHLINIAKDLIDIIERERKKMILINNTLNKLV